MKIISFVLLLFISCSIGHAESKGPLVLSDKNCQRNMGAMDFGSGTTKGLVAEVDICQRKILRIIFEDRLALPLNEALETSSDGNLPTLILTEALPKITELLNSIKAHNVTEVKAVATSVFRRAKNGKAQAEFLSKKIGVSIRVISQEEEAELGYWSALSQAKIGNQDNLIVWDIGGGSMQMYSVARNKIQIYQGSLASVSFKNQILRQLQFKDPKLNSSPNPIGQNKGAALQLAKNHAVLNVPPFFKEKAPTAHWIGVGGVLSMSVQKQVNKDSGEFSIDQLRSALEKGVLLKDSQIESEYKISDISNLALVLGYMEALKVKSIKTVQASLGQGLIFRDLR